MSGRGSFLAVVVFLALAVPVFGQGGTADISGAVFDQAKAVLPGATVTVPTRAPVSSEPRVAAADGRFSLPTLLPGASRSPRSFQVQTTMQTGLVLAVGQEVTLNLT